MREIPGLPGAGYTEALGINRLGEVVGASGDSQTRHAFLWRIDTGTQDLGVLPNDLSSAANAINDKAGKQVALAVAANISTKDDLKNLVEEANRAFGRIDTLVCNAASNPYYGPQAGISDDQFRKILDNNIVANTWLIGLVVPQMIERKDGTITIISSIGGLKGSTVLGAYAISKAADMQLARNLACEYGKHNVRVNCIAPGLIKTDFAKALWDNPETLKASTARSPLLRIGEPDEIAGGAIFLASKAGAFINGQSIVIDGGGTIS